MGNDTLMFLVMSECQTAVQAAEGTEAKLRAAMTKAKDHWMVLDPDLQFRGALGAVLQNLGKEHPDYARLSHEIKMLGKFAAMMHAAQAGLSVGLDSVFDEDDKPETVAPFGIAGMWREIAGPRAAYK